MEENKSITAKEFLNKNSLILLASPERILIEFAKLKVQEAIEQICKTECIKQTAFEDKSGKNRGVRFEYTLDKDSVRNAYKLDSIQ
jgi:hypothetical protein